MGLLQPYDGQPQPRRRGGPERLHVGGRQQLHGRIRADGRFKVIQDEGSRTGVGSETFGWNLGDEVDMFGGACPGDLTSVKNSLPADRTARFSNYGKGVAAATPNPWSDLTEARCWINGQDSTSIDFYWFTDPYDGPGNRFGYRYGEVVDRVRGLTHGRPAPADLELRGDRPAVHRDSRPGRKGDPPRRARTAAWHSVIAGARGIMCFQHSSAGRASGPSHDPLELRRHAADGHARGHELKQPGATSSTRAS